MQSGRAATLYRFDYHEEKLGEHEMRIQKIENFVIKK